MLILSNFDLDIMALSYLPHKFNLNGARFKEKFILLEKYNELHNDGQGGWPNFRLERCGCLQKIKRKRLVIICNCQKYKGRYVNFL